MLALLEKGTLNLIVCALPLLVSACALTDVAIYSQTDTTIIYCAPTPPRQNPDELAAAFCEAKDMGFRNMAFDSRSCSVGLTLGQQRAYECIPRDSQGAP